MEIYAPRHKIVECFDGAWIYFLLNIYTSNNSKSFSRKVSSGSDPDGCVFELAPDLL